MPSRFRSFRLLGFPGLSPAALGLALSAVFAASCAGAPASTAQSATSPSVPLVIEHQDCATDSKAAVKIDSNGDGKPDIIRVMSDGREVCRLVDLNHDGHPDAYVYLDASGAISRRESDFDRDGKIDEVAEYVGGVVVRKSRETNLDGRLDTWDFFENGKLVRRLRDTDGNGTVDQWWTWPHPDKPECPVVASDRNGDGQPEASDTVDTCAPPSDAPAGSSTAANAPRPAGSSAPAGTASSAPLNAPAGTASSAASNATSASSSPSAAPTSAPPKAH